MGSPAKGVDRDAAVTAVERVETTPLERAKQILVGMVRSEKEQRWIGVRMENFHRAYEGTIASVSLKDACDYLESLMRRGQADWQVKQSLDGLSPAVRVRA